MRGISKCYYYYFKWKGNFKVCKCYDSYYESYAVTQAYNSAVKRLVIYSWETPTHVHKEVKVVHCSIVCDSEKLEAAQYPLIGEQVPKLLCITTVEICTVVKMNEVLLHVWNIILDGKSKLQKNSYIK